MLRAVGLGWPFQGLPKEADPFFDPSCMSHNSELEWMGYTVRSKSWRFTEWLSWDGEGLCGVAPSAAAAAELIELYDHRSDTTPLDLDAAEYFSGQERCNPNPSTCPCVWVYL